MIFFVTDIIEGMRRAYEVAPEEMVLIQLSFAAGAAIAAGIVGWLWRTWERV
jgi:hypothetical protein